MPWKTTVCFPFECKSPGKVYQEKTSMYIDMYSQHKDSLILSSGWEWRSWMAFGGDEESSK